VSKLLPFNHPANETLDSVKDFLTIQEAQEEKRKKQGIWTAARHEYAQNTKFHPNEGPQFIGGKTSQCSE